MVCALDSAIWVQENNLLYTGPFGMLLDSDRGWGQACVPDFGAVRVGLPELALVTWEASGQSVLLRLGAGRGAGLWEACQALLPGRR